MAFTLAQRLQSLGVATQLAVEIQRQIDEGDGDGGKLRALGMAPSALADYIADNIPATGAGLSALKLTRYAMPPEVATLIVKSNNAPRNTALPAITGTAQVGQTLTRTTGTWSGSTPITYATAWLAGGVVISGATGATYVPVIGDVGKTITVRVTPSNASGAGTPAVSAPTSAVIAA